MFFHPNLPNYGIFSLNEKESYHCVKVLRYRNNSTIRVTDGKGKLAYCKIEDASEKKIIINVSFYKEVQTFHTLKISKKNFY